MTINLKDRNINLKPTHYIVPDTTQQRNNKLVEATGDKRICTNMGAVVFFSHVRTFHHSEGDLVQGLKLDTNNPN